MCMKSYNVGEKFSSQAKARHEPTLPRTRIWLGYGFNLNLRVQFNTVQSTVQVPITPITSVPVQSSTGTR